MGQDQWRHAGGWLPAVVRRRSSSSIDSKDTTARCDAGAVNPPLRPPAPLACSFARFGPHQLGECFGLDSDSIRASLHKREKLTVRGANPSAQLAGKFTISTYAGTPQNARTRARRCFAAAPAGWAAAARARRRGMAPPPRAAPPHLRGGKIMSEGKETRERAVGGGWRHSSKGTGKAVCLYLLASTHIAVPSASPSEHTGQWCSFV